MTAAQQKVYLITEPQRDALLSYLQERPYKEVASGIEFLLNATTAVLSASSEEGDASPDEEATVESSETTDQ